MGMNYTWPLVAGLLSYVPCSVAPGNYTACNEDILFTSASCVIWRRGIGSYVHIKHFIYKYKQFNLQTSHASVEGISPSRRLFTALEWAFAHNAQTLHHITTRSTNLQVSTDRQNNWFYCANVVNNPYPWLRKMPHKLNEFLWGLTIHDHISRWIIVISSM